MLQHSPERFMVHRVINLSEFNKADVNWFAEPPCILYQDLQREHNWSPKPLPRSKPHCFSWRGSSARVSS